MWACGCSTLPHLQFSLLLRSGSPRSCVRGAAYVQGRHDSDSLAVRKCTLSPANGGLQYPLSAGGGRPAFVHICSCMDVCTCHAADGPTDRMMVVWERTATDVTECQKSTDPGSLNVTA
jgi:hypothetical protein